MFDVGFQELILVAIVALVVVGPERLPKVARVAGKWVGHARRTLANVKHEIDRELKAEELKTILDEQSRLKPLDTILEDPALTTPRPAPATESQTPPSTPVPPQAEADRTRSS
ncbi:Sec-independent protein translocase protein TatB [Allochromatium palmeri]|uniref:Sec-independent protein translocase protein TatB n=1 Tax=Allochromatium palmeri TaxID=231048 RepID=A0A6N8EI97_9GAMM|nr:Sec-independent protein translocase protein TatB [Allochromatium palmeri]MTW22446.1 twin-arginine translocase subunit TatB [Allochromatium palmeri]